MTGPLTILLVDDEELVRAFVRAALERAGHTVLEAAGGWEALRLADTYAGSIDLLLTDVNMPGLDGFELARRFTARRPEASALHMSGHVPGPTPADALLLAKPFTLAALYEAVGDALVRTRAA